MDARSGLPTMVRRGRLKDCGLSGAIDFWNTTGSGAVSDAGVFRVTDCPMVGVRVCEDVRSLCRGGVSSWQLYGDKCRFAKLDLMHGNLVDVSHRRDLVLSDQRIPSLADARWESGAGPLLNFLEEARDWKAICV
jgi:hypothetical protein